MRNLALHDAKPNDAVAVGRDGPRSSDRVLQLLIVVGAAVDGLTLTEAAAEVGLVASTALRQLRSLEAAGLLERSDEDQVYRPGPVLIDLSRTIFVGHTLVAAAQPYLDQMALATGESAYLATAETGRTAIYLATAAGGHALRHSGWLGRVFQTRGTAVGAALRGRVDPDGVVSRSGSVEDGITAVSAPLRSRLGVVGAFSVVGPSFRLDGVGLARARATVAQAAAGMSVSLGQQLSTCGGADVSLGAAPPALTRSC